jgi:hypothetical protein
MKSKLSHLAMAGTFLISTAAAAAVPAGSNATNASSKSNALFLCAFGLGGHVRACWADTDWSWG